MRQILFVCWLLGVVVQIASLQFLPDRVAMHFGMDGTPDGWGRASTHASLMIGVQTLLLFLVLAIPWVVKKTPPRFVNIPNRDYWLSSDRIDETVSRIREHCDLLGVILQAFFIALGVCVASANLTDPVVLRPEYFVPILVVFLLSMSGWACRLCLAFRVNQAVSETSPDQE